MNIKTLVPLSLTLSMNVFGAAISWAQSQAIPCPNRFTISPTVVNVDLDGHGTSRVDFYLGQDGKLSADLVQPEAAPAFGSWKYMPLTQSIISGTWSTGALTTVAATSSAVTAVQSVEYGIGGQNQEVFVKVYDPTSDTTFGMHFAFSTGTLTCYQQSGPLVLSQPPTVQGYSADISSFLAVSPTLESIQTLQSQLAAAVADAEIQRQLALLWFSIATNYRDSTLALQDLTGRQTTVIANLRTALLNAQGSLANAQNANEYLSAAGQTLGDALNKVNKYSRKLNPAARRGIQGILKRASQQLSALRAQHR